MTTEEFMDITYSALAEEFMEFTYSTPTNDYLILHSTSPIVKEMEMKYPEMTSEFKTIMMEQYEIFCEKQMNYGPTNISLGTQLKTTEEVRLSLTGLWFRMNDKIQRLKQLIVLGGKDVVGETVNDTYQDLSVYGIICQIVNRGKWAK